MNENDKRLLEIGKRITDRRKSLGWTQEELADRGDLTPQFVSYAESGKRAMRPENLLKLSSTLGVSADFLLSGDIIDKDMLLMSDKLRRLTPEQRNIIEKIIDLLDIQYALFLFTMCNQVFQSIKKFLCNIVHVFFLPSLRASAACLVLFYPY